MAGTVKGRIDCFFHNSDTTKNVKDMFVGLHKFLTDLATANYTELISLQYGSGGTGMDYSDGANPPGTNSFYVFRFKPSASRTWSWYLLAQCGNNASFGNAPGDPGLVDAGTSQYSLGLAMAVALDGGGADASPWTGHTAKAGADKKGPGAGGPGGTAVWAPPGGGTLYVLPRSNGTGGSHATVKQNCVSFYSYNSTDPFRVHFLADLDNLAIIGDISDTGNRTHYAHMGIYNPITGLSPTIPMMMLSNGSSYLDNSTSFGPTTGGAPNGGVIQALDNTARRGIFTARIADEYSTMQPNMQFAVSTYVESRIAVYADESPNAGLLGFMDPFIRQTYNCPTYTLLNSDTRIVVGTATTADGKVTFPWNASVKPKTSYSRDGVSF